MSGERAENVRRAWVFEAGEGMWNGTSGSIGLESGAVVVSPRRGIEEEEKSVIAQPTDAHGSRSCADSP